MTRYSAEANVLTDLAIRCIGDSYLRRLLQVISWFLTFISIFYVIKL